MDASKSPRWPPHDPPIGFLGALDAKQAKDLHDRGIPRRFRKGQALFHQGGVSDRVVVVLRGRIKIRIHPPLPLVDTS